MSRSYKKYGGISICGSRVSDKSCRSMYHRSVRRKVKLLLHEIDFDYCYDPEVDDTGLGDVFKCGMCMVCKDCEENNWYEEYMLTDWDPNPNFCYNKNGCGKWIPENNPIDKIITKGFDRNVRMGDRWSWTSDGGSRYSESIRSIRKDFDAEVFGISAWHVGNNTAWDDYLGSKYYFSNKEPSVWQVSLEYKTKLKRRLNFPETIRVGFPVRETYWETETKTIEIPYKKYLRYSDLPNDGWYRVSALHHIRNHLRDYAKYVHGNFIWELFSTGKIPQNFEKPEELIEWLRKNEEHIVRSYYRRTYGK